jgi:hypothetical protein
MTSHEPLVSVPLTTVETETVQVQLAQVPGETHPIPPTAEQVRAADEVFARNRESEQVLGLLGMWTGTLLLHDIAKDTFATDPEEEELPRKKDEPDQD